MRHSLLSLSSLVCIFILLSACTPRIEVAIPQEPITINLNVKIEHSIKIQVDKELDDLFENEDDLF